MMVTIPEIRDYLVLKPDLYTGGQPTPDQIPWLREQKFEVVINLATEKSPDAIRNEQELVMENGMAYVHIPVEWENPKKADIQKFFHFFSSHTLFKTFTHCALNMRVSSFVFLFRTLVEKANPDDCLLDLLTIWKPNPTWQEFINSMLRDTDLSNPPINWMVDWDHLNIVPLKA
jgi:protein tyrosine phosphatase (PTP) superfamily phosphohydrolase (DUF442 family)